MHSTTFAATADITSNSIAEERDADLQIVPKKRKNKPVMSEFDESKAAPVTES